MNSQLAQIPVKLQEIEVIKSAISKIILELPDNPKIQRISDHPRCFVMSSKDAFGANQYGYTNMTLKNNISVFFHDFRAQYEAISEVVNHSTTECIISSLQEIVRTGVHRKYGRFHPQVIQNLANLIG